MILITGATGFVGSAVVRQLLELGEELKVLVRASSDRSNLTGLDVEFAVGDLTDQASLKRALAGCKALFHVAADYRLWARDPSTMYKANVEGSRDIVRLASEAGVSKIVYTSSVATLGIVPGGVGDEETPVHINKMIGHYKRSKYLAEQAVQELFDQQGAPVVIVNPSAPVGPRDIKPTPTGKMIVDAVNGKIPAYMDTGLNISHVDDIASGHILAWQKGTAGERYILGGENLELLDILTLIAELCDGKPPIMKMPFSVILPIAHIAEAWTRLTGGDDPFVCVDGVKMARKKMFFSSEKAARELGYRSRSARQALVDAIEWFKNNGYIIKK